MINPDEQDEAANSNAGFGIEELSRIFCLVAEQPIDRQTEMLHRMCPDERVRLQITKLLDADSADDALLDHSLYPAPTNVRAGERIAGYELLEKIGEGGMGVVFLAEQTEPVQRKVALKVIKPGVDTRQVIARFEAERQALSLMDHPNIAKVLDAGSTDTGRPFFVMELVEGLPITTSCDRNQWTIKQRLELFVTVCHAIQHAHQKGVIHRDIKPSNVLVTEYDGRPVAKVIDFGVSKAINQPLSEMSVHTGLGQIVGTFEYMSPEQSRVNPMDVDTRSDIYSLGVLLYELLTGSPPFDKERLRSVAWDEMLRIIREEDPPKPSSRLSEFRSQPTKDDPTFSDRKRDRTEPKRLVRMVRGELDWIVLKAMDKERNRRYGTPNGLANDIERFLCGDAVTACPPSSVYRFRKFVSRNKVVLATSAIVAASLILGLVGTTWQAIRARRAEEATQAVNNFLVDDLLGLAGAESQLSAGLRPDPNLKLTTLLDRALAEVNSRFPDQPQLKANLQSTLASSFSSIGRYEEATSLYQQLLEFQTQNQGEEHPDTIRATRQLARAYFDQSKIDIAQPIYDKAIARSRKFLGNENELTLLLLNDLAMLYQKQGRYRESESAFEDCLRVRKRLLGNGHRDTLGTMSNLATLYESLDRFADAEELHQQVLATRRQTLPDQHPRIADALHNLGRCCLKRGRHDDDSNQFERSLPLLDEGLVINLQNLGIRGPDHPATIGLRCDLAQVYLEQSRYDDAVVILVDLVERLQRLRSADYVTTLDVMSMLGWTYLRLDRPEEAENILTEVHASCQRSDPRDPWAIQVRGNLAIALYRLAKLDEAIALDEKTVELAKEVLGAGHVETLSAMARLGLSYLEVGSTEAGRTLLEYVVNAGENHPGAFIIAGRLAISYAQDKDVPKSHAWSNRQIELARFSLPIDSPQLTGLLAERNARILRPAIAKADETESSQWTNLLDRELSQWEVFMGVPHTSVDVDWPSKSESGTDGIPMGLNNDPLNVFSVKEIDGENVLCISGQIYGGLTSLQEFENYQLSLEFKWGDRKWAPRENQKRDSGLLIHCVGKHGAFWNVWMRSLECQIQEGDCGDFIALAGSGCNIRVRRLVDSDRPQFDPTQPLYHGTGYVSHGPSDEKPHGQWNTVELFALGQTTVFVVNGKPNMVLERSVQETADGWKPLSKGKLQIQSEAAEIYYRNIKIRPLKSFPESLESITQPFLGNVEWLEP